MAHDKLIVRGAREHNLKNITVELPRDQLVVITGLSGSGKSSLAFDTIYAEGQRRYVESLSAYARQFLSVMEKPDVDHIEGLSPAISIDQKGASRNPRSTVGTTTEIYDYLRLLYARVGTPHCPNCGREIAQQSAQQIVDSILEMPAGSRILILAPLIQARKGEHKGIFEDVRKAGFVRVRVNGEVHDVDEEIELDRYKNHTIEAVVDRLVVVKDGEGALDLSRLTDSVETALRLGGGAILVSDVSQRDAAATDRLYSEHFACVHCGISLPEIEPRTFSFNSPHGACQTCSGLGVQMEFDPEMIASNPDLSLAEGALNVSGWGKQGQKDEENHYRQLLRALCAKHHIPFTVAWKELSNRQREIILFGAGQAESVAITYHNTAGQLRTYETTYEAVIPHLQRRYRESTSDYIRSEMEELMTSRPCPVCGGKRLRPEALAVTIINQNIDVVTQFSVIEALEWVRLLQGETAPVITVAANGRDGAPESQRVAKYGDALEVPAASPLTQRQWTIARQILKEIRARLGFMADVGLNYLSLKRGTATLSGGEAQRIRLATQIGSQLMGVLYILDEPSIGLHQRDNARLIRTLIAMRDLGNTVLVVEHDEETMRAADWIVDMGPGAGEHGGQVVCSAPRDRFIECPDSLTARYLRGEERIEVPTKRRDGNGKTLLIKHATENNLQGVDVRIPLGKFICVTGVSGSGKSSLVIEVLYKRLAQSLYRAKDKPGAHETILGIEQLDKVIDIDQSAIGRTPRSNPATYTALFGPLRDLFARLPDAKLRGYGPGRFSFNVKGGRCEACQGDGTIRIEMQFLPDVWVPCEVCHGKRYNRDTLQILYKGKSIADTLDMTVEEAHEFFNNIPAIRNKLKTLEAVGLGYIRLGQAATTLSGGEAQRIKLSKELSRRDTGDTLYILDEPTTGLHFADTRRLLQVLHDLADRGNTLVVIEHNLDVIKSADWVIDMGPEGGNGGGRIIAEGRPEEVAQVSASYTGQFLQHVLPQIGRLPVSAAFDPSTPVN
ncbi:excinuclease ABC subunit UvrA [Candidatus Amarolinea dominans]|uniref:excinuclease ABC subunit UvrA n=1 Tax=Candidatus Amarolinea dominans TaxID=3140696 RepID=UPI001D39987A|nr:excinuclease ABC subunit UvrA [Anaerolineae bacterium]